MLDGLVVLAAASAAVPAKATGVASIANDSKHNSGKL
jgi:hypothetical protein